MSVSWQPVDIPFGAGIDTKTDEKVLRPPGLADLQNAVFTATPGYRKRNGYRALRRNHDDNANVTYGVFVASHGNEILLGDKKNLYSYDEVTERWLTKDTYLPVIPEVYPRSVKPVNQTRADLVVKDDIRVVVWYDDSDSTVHYSVTNEGSDVVYVADGSIAGADRPYVLAVGDRFHIYYWKSGATALALRTINISAPTAISSETTLVNDVNGGVGYNGVYALCKHPAGDAVLVAYYNSAAYVKMFVVLESGALGAGVTTNGFPANTNIDTDTANRTQSVTAIGISANSDYVYLGYSEDSGFSTTCAQVVLTDFTSVTYHQNTSVPSAVATTGIAVAANQDTTTEAYIWVDEGSTGTPRNSELHYGKYSDWASASNVLKHTCLASSAFWLNGLPCVNACYDSGSLQNSYFLIDHNGLVHGRMLYGTAEGLHSYGGHLPIVKFHEGESHSSDHYHWAATYRTRLSINNDPTLTLVDDDVHAQFGIKEIALYVDWHDHLRAFQAGRSLYLNAGMIHQYDGVNIVEQGFLLFPDNVSIANSGDTTGINLAGSTSYSYRVYYEWYNDQGERQRSSGLIVSHTTASTPESLNIVIPTLTMTRKDNVAIVVYRTEGNPDILGGAPFYRVTSSDPADTGLAENAYLVNDKTTNTVTLVDNLSDANLVKRELDYQNTGELDNVAVDSGTVFMEARGRFWVAGLEDPNKAIYSKLRYPSEQLEFNDALYLSVPEEGGGITAISELTHFVVIFKERSIYVVSGEGPDNFGNGAFNTPQLVSSDVGCISPYSIARMPMGLMFKSRKGIYLLTDNLQVTYIGAPVEAFNDQEIVSAHAIPDKNQVRFLAHRGRTLVYDYHVGQWTTFTNHEGEQAVLWQNQYCYMKENGKVLVEDPDLYTDDGASYKLKLKTAPLAMTGTQGYQRCRSLWILGEYYSPHELRVRAHFDHNPASVATSWVPDDVINTSMYGEGDYGDGPYGGSGSPVYQAQYRLDRQKCQVVQFTIEDSQSTAGRAMEITHLKAEMAPKKGPAKVGASYKFAGSS